MAPNEAADTAISAMPTQGGLFFKAGTARRRGRFEFSL